ncbi:thiamine pyrophosphate-binding protein [Chitinimonas sp. JJ19]|uniref:thiamine pyrophosphate-binding protein n=1 Tax=Chitinimonas sp. JJ19 TaxID=3109352 RepID=UPI00300345CD
MAEQMATAGLPEPTDVAEVVVRYLEAIGVEYVFGVPGGAVEPIYNALARSARRGGPRAVVARHEAGAAFMAEGYTRETGKVGVCISTSGPGATNLLTGVANAYDNSIPMLAITGQPSLPSFGRGALQESACTGVNTLGMFRHCTRYNSLVSHPEQVESKLVSAIMRTHRAPYGPAHLSFPVDILRAPAPGSWLNYDLRNLIEKPSLVDIAVVRQLAADIHKADKIAIIIGSTCGEAIEAILELAERTHALFVTTPDGKGLVNPRHQLYRGVFGFAGHYTANAVLLDDPDLVLAFGVSLGEWTSAAWCETVLNNRLVHIDVDDEHLMRSPMARLHVRGRISTVCELLVESLRGDEQRAQERAGKVSLRSVEGMLREPEKYESQAVPIKPQRLMRELSRRCPPTTRFYADAGNSTAWAIHYLQPRDRRIGHQHDFGRTHADVGERRQDHAGWLRVIMDFAPMGWAIGAAVGGARGNPDCPCVCITGDGSYLMNGQEITVAAAEKLSVLFVILNDGALGMVKHGQRLAGAERTAFELPTVDYRLLAESLGVPGFVIRSPEDFEQIDIEAILRRKGPTLLDVRIDGEEVPPMSLRMKTLGSER